MTKAELQAADKILNIDGNIFPDADITSDKWKGWSSEESLPRKNRRGKFLAC